MPKVTHQVYLNSLQASGQTSVIPGYEDQSVKNNAGGYVFDIESIKQFERFLILGTLNGTYYTSPMELTKENIENSRSLMCIKNSWKKAIDMIVDVSTSGRGISNDPCIIALAVAISNTDNTILVDGKSCMQYACDKILDVCRTGTHLFHLCAYLKKLRGVGTYLKKSISKWYSSRSYESLEKQVAKYQQRDGWSHADVIKRFHVKPMDERVSNIFLWIIDNKEKPFDIEKLSGLPKFMEIAKTFSEFDIDAMTDLIKQYDAPFECVPTEYRAYPQVWKAMLPTLGMESIMRNLVNMSKYGVFKDKEYLDLVVSFFENKDKVKSSRLHPIKILNAMRMYRRRSDNDQYEFEFSILGALESAFYNSFNYIESTNEKYLLALDVSGSMFGSLVTTNGKEGSLSAAEVGACIAMVLARTEPNSEFVAFSHSLISMNFSKFDSLEKVISKMQNIPYGGTDVALPVLYASSEGRKFDKFVTITDNETWAGKVHPITALVKYRNTINEKAKAISAAVSVTSYSVYPDTDYTMNVVGFDTNLPTLVSQF